MAWQTFALRDADLRYQPRWLSASEADEALVAVRDAVCWERHRIRMFGREVEVPRLSCWIGDPDAIYHWSHTRFEPRSWPPVLRGLRDRLHTETGIGFNSVLANLYRDGADSMGWHADDEPEIDPDAAIASLSLGGPRRFVLRQPRDRTQRCAIELAHGSLLWMAGDTQRHWQHALPKTRLAVPARINLTFRRIVAPRT